MSTSFNCSKLTPEFSVEISVSEAQTFELDFPYSKITSLIDDLGLVGPRILKALLAESNKRVAQAAAVPDRWISHKIPISLKNVRGIIPALSLEEFANGLPRSRRVGELLGLSELLSSVFLEFGIPECDCGAGPMRKSAPNIAAREISLHIEANDLIDETIIVTSWHQNLKSSRARSRVIESLRGAGFERFIVDGRVVKWASDLSLQEERKARSIFEGVREFGVVVKTLSSNRLSTEELVQAIESALGDRGEVIPTGISMIQIGKDGADNPRWFSARNFFCERCGRTLQLEREEILQGDDRGKQPKVLVHISSATFSDCLEMKIPQLLERCEGWVTLDRRDSSLVSKCDRSSGLTRLITDLKTMSVCNLKSISLGQKVGELSNGQLVKVAICYFVLTAVSEILFLLSEIGSEFEDEDVTEIYEALRVLTRNGNSVVTFEGMVNPNLSWINFLSLASAGQSSHANQHNRLQFEISKKQRAKQVYASRNAEVLIPVRSVVSLRGRSGAGKTRILQALSSLGKRKNFAQIPGAQTVKISAAIHRVVFGSKNGRRGSVSSARGGKTVAEISGLDFLIGKEFSKLPLARREGFSAEYFSLSNEGGRCKACAGLGVSSATDVNSFAADEQCESCGGLRFESPVLAVRYKEKNIADVLEMTVREAQLLFATSGELQRYFSLLTRLEIIEVRLGDLFEELTRSVQQRLNFALQVLQNRGKGTLLLLEHPLAGLKEEEVEQCLLVMRQFAEEEGSIVFTTNNSAIAAKTDLDIFLG